MKNSISRLYITSVAHTTAILFVVFRKRPDFIPVYWQGQICVLLIISYLVSLFLSLPGGQKTWAPYAAAFLHFLICFTIGNAEGEDLILELILMSVIATDLCFHIRGSSLFILLGLTSAGFSILQRETILWWTTVNAPPVESILLINIIFWGEALLFRHIRVLQSRLNETLEINANMKNIIKNYSSSGTVLQGSSQSESHLVYEEERKIFIHEIHDTVSYSLVNIIALLEAVTVLNTRDGNNPSIPQLLTKAKEQAKISLRELRVILRGLHNRSSASNCDLLSLKEMTNRFEKITGIRIRIELGNLPNFLGKDVFHILFLFIQEGLTNAFKHGRATEVSIYLWIMDEELSALIMDNGRGCENAEKGLGFYGIEERMKKYRGRFSYRNLSRGFEIRINLPYKG